MLRFRSSKMTAGVLASAILIVAAGGGVVASNMGFKINKQLFPIAQIINAIGDNQVALPYRNPYPNASDLCGQASLSFPVGNQATLTWVNPANNVATNFVCPTTPVAGQGFIIPTNGVGIRIREKGFCSGAPATFCTVCCDTSLAAPFNCATAPGGTCPAGAVDTCGASGPCVARSHIKVGSHNPTQAVSVPRFCSAAGNPAGCTGAQGELWFSVPYHTTAVTAADLCAQGGLKTTIPQTLITRRRADTGQALNANCGTPAASALNLVLGEAIRIHETDPAGKTFVPAHF